MKSDEELDGLLGISGARELAEHQLLKLVREEDSDGFELKITFSNGRWTISMHDFDSGVSGVGEGETFTEAWHLYGPQWPERT